MASEVESASKKQLRRRVIITDNVWRPAGPYSHAVVLGKKVYVTGIVGLSPVDGSLVEGGIEAEAHQALKNIGNILKAAGTDYNHGKTNLVDLYSCSDVKISGRAEAEAKAYFIALIKATVFLTDIADWSKVNQVYQQYFKSHFPARSALQVQALPRGAHIEIECKAVIGQIVDDD